MTFFRRLLALLDGRARRRLIGLLLLMLAGAFLEALGVGLVLPLLALLDERGGRTPWLIGFRRAIGDPPVTTLVTTVAAMLVVVYVAKNAYLAMLAWAQSRFVFDEQARVSSRLLSSYLQREWSFYLQRNSSEMLRTITQDAVLVFNSVLPPALTIVVESLVALGLFLVLVAVEPVSAIVTAVLLGGLGLGIYGLLRRRLATLGAIQHAHAGKLIRSVTDAMGGAKEIKVLGREQYFLAMFERSAGAYSRSIRAFRVAGELPRLTIETLAVCAFLLVLVTLVFRGDSLDTVVPTLGLFAAAGMRLMPSTNRIVTAIGSIRYNAKSLEAVHEDLVNAIRPTPPFSQVVPLTFRDAVQVEDVTFQYPGAATSALSSVRLTIRRGSSVAIVGASGAGKSTLLDVLLGLLPPTSGRVLVDDADLRLDSRRWQRAIGFIPQPSFLADDTLRRNVAFGVPDEEIDDERVRATLAAARLDGLVTSHPEGLNQVVGERGLRLSAGQRQRIGIARALYSDPAVLVMDEATSFLDYGTEAEIITEISRFRGERTLIFVAHRLSTVRHCDTLFFLKDGRLVQSGSYDELIATNEDFRTMAQAAVAA